MSIEIKAFLVFLLTYVGFCGGIMLAEYRGKYVGIFVFEWITVPAGFVLGIIAGFATYYILS
jgi:hypothetical protein